MHTSFHGSMPLWFFQLIQITFLIAYVLKYNLVKNKYLRKKRALYTVNSLHGENNRWPWPCEKICFIKWPYMPQILFLVWHRYLLFECIFIYRLYGTLSKRNGLIRMVMQKMKNHLHPLLKTWTCPQDLLQVNFYVSFVSCCHKQKRLL